MIVELKLGHFREDESLYVCKAEFVQLIKKQNLKKKKLITPYKL